MSAAVSLPAYPRTCDEDGTHHFSHVKLLALSGRQYLHGVNTKKETTAAMRKSTAVHELILGPRAGKKVVVFKGDRRGTNEWKAFVKQHPDDAEILTAPEWAEAEEMAAAVLADPIAQARLAGARFEVPLKWEDGGLLCSTDGVDIIGGGALGDLKGTNTAEPERFKRLAFRMYYHCQLAWYRRGARANGIDVSKGLFVLGYEMKPPFECVDLELTESLADLGEQTLSLWLEKLRVYKESNQFPGYAQSPVPWDVPPWMLGDDDEDEDGEEVTS